MPTTPGGRALGLNFAPPDPRTWAFPHTRSLVTGAPPDIDLRRKMQAVGNQGPIGSCTGWAGTAALEAKLGDGQRSPLYVYYYDRREDGTAPGTDGGATMLGLCKALKDYGAPPEYMWPYDPSRFSVEPNVTSLDSRIDAYYQVQGVGLSLLQGVWAALAQGDTPLLAFNVYRSFERVGHDGKVRMPVTGEQVIGGHAVCACMWFNDNSAPGGYGWVGIQNSWGEGIGDLGYFYLPAAYFISGIVREAWVIAVTAPVPPPPDPEPDVSDVDQAGREMDAAMALLDAARYDLRDTDPDAAWTYVGEASRIMGVARDRLPKVPPAPDPPSPGPEPPPVPVLSGVYGTYSGHGLAQDLYGGTTDEQVQWGPHHGLPLVAPVDGRVELYQIGTPLSAQTGLAAFDPVYRVNWHALSDEWVCRVPPHLGAQVMYVAVFWPTGPLWLNGTRCGHLHYGHVRSNVTTGSVAAGQPFATTWDSGIRFENAGITNARAAHTHCCAGAGTTLSPNGDLDGRLAVLAQGWSVTDLRSIPGPSDYQSGAYCAGRRLTDFTSGGHPIPPLPS